MSMIQTVNILSLHKESPEGKNTNDILQYLQVPRLWIFSFFHLPLYFRRTYNQHLFIAKK